MTDYRELVNIKNDLMGMLMQGVYAENKSRSCMS